MLCLGNSFSGHMWVEYRLKYSLRKYSRFILPHFGLSSGLCESVIIFKKGCIFQYRYDNLHHFCLHFSGMGILSSHLMHFYAESWEECKWYCLLCLLKTSFLYTLKKVYVLSANYLYCMFSSVLNNDWCLMAVLVDYSHSWSLIMATETNTYDTKRQKLCLLKITFLHHRHR